MDPIGHCFAETLRGIKHFQDFNKADGKFGILKVSKPFLKHNKMERLSNGPPSVLLSQSLRGIKHFQDLKKADYRH